MATRSKVPAGLAAILAALILAAGVGLAAAEQAGDPSMAAVLERNVPAFGSALIAQIDAFQPGQPAPDTALLQSYYDAIRAGRPAQAPAPDVLARLYLARALSAPDARSEAASFLSGLGAPGAEAKTRLLGLSSPSPSALSGAKTTAVSQNLDQMKAAPWDEAGSRQAFDKDASQGSAGATPAPATPLTPAPGSPPPTASPAAPAGPPPPVLPGPEPKVPFTTKIVSLGLDALKKLATQQLYAQREEGLNKALGITDRDSLGGAGVFTVKILNPDEVKADRIKQAVRDEAAKNGQKVAFVRTNIKAQLFGSHAIPIVIPGDPLSTSIGLRLEGIIEIVETRAIPEDLKGALQHAEKRIFYWPLSTAHLRDDMKVGEDLSITGRLDPGAAFGAGFGENLGHPAFINVGVGLNASAGAAADQWATLHISKIDPDHVRLLLQKGNGEVVSATVSLTAGVSVYDDSFIPWVAPASVDGTFVGKAVASGESAAVNAVANLARAELSTSWSRGRHDVESEGFGAVSLSDPKVSAALDDYVKFKPQALRALPPQATYSAGLHSGRLTADIRDVTQTEAIQAKLIQLKAVRSAQTAFYEVREKLDNGHMDHYLVGVAGDTFRGDFTKTAMNEQSAMWENLDTGRTAVTIALGPQQRLFTTTRERVDDVIATQKALGLHVDAKINPPHPYLEFFGLGNYGRSVEDGQFVLYQNGIDSLKSASRDDLTSAYLKADWIYEKQHRFPGSSIFAEQKPPVWAEGAAPSALEPALAYLRANAAEVQRLGFEQSESDRDKLFWIQQDYQKLAPGRTIETDGPKYLAADAYAGRVLKMQQAGGSPEQLINLFLELRRDGRVDLKRGVAATASLAAGASAEPGAYTGYIEMTGKRVNLKPIDAAPAVPEQPIAKVNWLLQQWQY